MSIWWIMLAGGLLTYAIRASFILAWGKFEVPLLVQRALRYVPPAVLAAIIFPELFLPSGQLMVSLANTRLLAGMCAILVAWKTKNALLTILVGMAALYLFQWIW